MHAASWTLLLTDVVGSTELTRRLGDDEAGRWWAVNDRHAREQLRRWRGREIDRTDGMLMLFESPDDALRCAQGYHEALLAARAPFLARAGVHRGPLTLIENTAADVAQGAKPLDVEGLALAMVARVMSAAQGGQTLLSADVAAALAASQNDLPRWRSHGFWRLGGLGEPSELFELVRAGFAADPPQDQAKAYRVRREGGLWRPLREISHSLRAERDRFVGRQEPLHRLATLLDGGARLVTVTGMGGIGKTRLALRCAWAWLGEYPGGVWFCDLAPARDVGDLCRAVAQGIGVPLAGAEPEQQLARAMAGHGRCLVILDNFEHLVALAEQTVGAWLDSAAEARFVVTSRERLSLVGEAVLDLEPMDERDAVELFRRRAAAAGTEVSAADEDSTVLQLVGMLDRLPLAIELAAARARVMSPRVLVSRMHQRFALLASRTGRDERRSTLRATLDWSWELLGPAEQALLAQISVFVGGFSLDACEQLAELPRSGAAETLAIDALQSLIDRSLVRRVADDRFDLLQTVAAYAAGRLGSDPTAAQSAADRHARHFASLGPRRAVANACAELDNLIAACRHAIARRDATTAVRALACTHAAVSLRGPWKALLDLAEAVIALPALDPGLKLSALLDAAHAAQFAGAVARSRECFAQAAALAPTVPGEPALKARAWRAEADALLRQGDSEGWGRLYAQALSAAEASDDVGLRCNLLNRGGAVAELQGRAEAARDLYEQALALAREHGERRWEGGSAGNLGQLLANRGEFEEASRMYQKAIAIAEELGDRQWEANARCNLGLLQFDQGQPAAALPELAHAADAARTLGHPRLLAIVLCNLGLVKDELGDLDEAESQFRKALEVARELSDTRSEGQFLGYLGWLLARRGRMEEARNAFGMGRTLLAEFSDTLSMGIHIALTAMAEATAGNSELAHRLLEEARRLASGIPELRPESELARTIARAASEVDRASSRPENG